MNFLKLFPYYLHLLNSLNLRRFLNLVLVESGYFFSRAIRKPLLAGNPWAASIEPTTSCNLRCPECPTGMRSLSRSKGNMSLEAYGKILNKLSPDLIYLTLYFQGEPLLNPHFSEMVQMARKQRIFVATSTNGHFFNDDNIENIIKSGLNHLIISMDGVDQQTYEQYRINGNLQIVSEGIKRLIKAKKVKNSATPFIELQFLVMRHNEHQIQQMREFAKQAGVDKLAFKTAQVYNFDAESTLVPTLKSKSRYRQTSEGKWVMAKKIRNRCHRIWSSLVITWDGKVVPCCYDKDAEHQTGNLVEQTLAEIWRNHQYTAFRRQLLQNRSETGICRNCGE